MFSSILLLFALLFWVLRALFRSPQFLAFIARTKYNTYHAAVPCYPHLDVFWGLDLLFQTWRDTKAGQLSEGLRRRHETYGSTFIANNLGSTCIHTIDPENIHAITTGKFEDYGKSAWVQEAAKHIGCGILTNEGQAWKQSRLTLKPIFTRTALDEPAMVEPHIQGLIKHMQKLGQEEGVFDAHELLSMLALDLTTEFVFGKSTRCLQMPITSDGADGLHFLSLVEQFEKAAGTFFAVGSLAWLEIIPHLRRLKGVADGMKRFFSKNLADIVSAHGTRPQIDSERSKDKRSFTPPSVFRLMSAADIPIERIQGEMQNVFFASYDTTSAFLANLVGIIVRHPDVQTRLRDEIKFLDGTAPTNQDLAKMEYLRLVIMESKSALDHSVNSDYLRTWLTFSLPGQPFVCVRQSARTLVKPKSTPRCLVVAALEATILSSCKQELPSYGAPTL